MPTVRVQECHAGEVWKGGGFGKDAADCCGTSCPHELYSVVWARFSPRPAPTAPTTRAVEPHTPTRLLVVMAASRSAWKSEGVLLVGALPPPHPPVLFGSGGAEYTSATLPVPGPTAAAVTTAASAAAVAAR